MSNIFPHKYKHSQVDDTFYQKAGITMRKTEVVD
jgi:hypothetical protein